MTIVLQFGTTVTKHLKKKFERLQNRAARFITGDTYYVRSKYILTKLGWKNLDECRILQTESYVTKALHKKCPEGINEMFKFSNNEKCQLRNNVLVLMLSKPKTNAMERNFSYTGAKIWNNQTIDSRNKVLNELNFTFFLTFSLTECFYNVNVGQ